MPLVSCLFLPETKRTIVPSFANGGVLQGCSGTEAESNGPRGCIETTRKSDGRSGDKIIIHKKSQNLILVKSPTFDLSHLIKSTMCVEYTQDYVYHLTRL